MVKYAGYWQ